jgi:hypothetical protein
MSALKKESESILTVMKSSIDLISGPTGFVNNISSTATSNVDEFGLTTLTYSLTGCSSLTFRLCPACLTKSEAASAAISEDARVSEY